MIPKRIFSLTDQSIGFMEDQVAAEKPFYLQVSHYAMHIWHDSLEETREKYKSLPMGRKYQKKDDLPEEKVLPPFENPMEKAKGLLGELFGNK